MAWVSPKWRGRGRTKGRPRKRQATRRWSRNRLFSSGERDKGLFSFRDFNFERLPAIYRKAQALHLVEIRAERRKGSRNCVKVRAGSENRQAKRDLVRDVPFRLCLGESRVKPFPRLACYFRGSEAQRNRLRVIAPKMVPCLSLRFQAAPPAIAEALRLLVPCAGKPIMTDRSRREHS